MDVQSGRQVHIVIHRRRRYDRQNSTIVVSFGENGMFVHQYGVHR